MIDSLEVRKLNNKITDKFHFNDDLNIITGDNGCGKTTILKLMWYLMSGNYEEIFEEIDFQFAKIIFKSNDFVSFEIIEKKSEKYVKLIVDSKRKKLFYENTLGLNNIDQFPKFYSDAGSYFFPTFRRIEGGFSINSTKKNNGKYRTNRLRESLEVISENLNTGHNHKFISSISTEDINYLLSNKYAQISDEIRKIDSVQSKSILTLVERTNDNEEKKSLAEIKEIVKDNDTQKNKILKPFTVLSDLIDKIFKDKSIKIENNLELGNTKKAINSNNLSAGEKQMLSFLCYNFFCDNSVIFIDEPELSLHIDWQRILFPTLLRQKKGNQFIIATHSPFIYSKYQNKEIIIGEKSK
ncbi:AAA family ATPase [Tenacibaculum finnmarkense]|uniref:AAA family ATPase n=1 Tax=Tenacibaculum finnmarkense TaxID=2781243 RepID=UPI001E35E5A4|nr:ATP-binding protein [Tenacibaculum finnmarkense]MCD8445559.1 ATP-binding protein [Tenacibaculum finnmarkense genomovar ulcerans]